MKRLAIFDIDDTLFDWLGMWSSTFGTLLASVARETHVQELDAARVFRAFHAKVGTSEYPYVARDLTALFPALEEGVATRLLSSLNDARCTAHSMHAGVTDVLARLKLHGVQIVLHTDAPPGIALRRVCALGLNHYASHLFSTRSSRYVDPVLPSAPEGRLSHVEVEFRKPDPRALHSILVLCGAGTDEAVYIGDSLYRDIAMAQDCNVLDVYAKYGCDRDGAAYKLLRDVSHWTDDDIAAEKELHARGVCRPTLVASSPNDLANHLGL